MNDQTSRAETDVNRQPSKSMRAQGRAVRNIQWLWLSVLVIAADQFSKYLVASHYTLFQSTRLLPWLNLTLVHNTGAAFSVLRGTTPWVFVGIAGVVAIGVAIWLARHAYERRLFAAALALIAGGALGNAIDRVTHGYVVDFVDFHIGAWHYPAFNLADSAIVTGAVLIVVEMLFLSGRDASQ